MARVFALATFVVAGIMLADLLIHPAGTTALGTSFVNAEKVSTNALLGKSS